MPGRGNIHTSRRLSGSHRINTEANVTGAEWVKEGRSKRGDCRGSGEPLGTLEIWLLFSVKWRTTEGSGQKSDAS